MGERHQRANCDPAQAVRLIACGAIASETLAIKAQAALGHIDLICLPAILHNSPQEIPAAVEKAVLEAREEGFTSIFVGYADCGTGGLLDKVCEKHGVGRLQGPHCYSFFSGNQAFSDLSENEFTAFYLTDFLARQFDAFVTRPLGLDRHPELRDSYFGHYEKLVFLAQTDDDELTKRAAAAAEQLGLAFERRFTGFGDLTAELKVLAQPS
ncbi:MAG: DUF1638 domain-containing protein [Pseudomonadota bacterium]